MNLEDIYQANVEDMKEKLYEMSRKVGFKNLHKSDLEELIYKIQIGYRPKSLYMALNTIDQNRQTMDEFNDSDTNKLKESMWENALSHPETLDIYEEYIQEIYTVEELNEYEFFKRNYLRRRYI